MIGEVWELNRKVISAAIAFAVTLVSYGNVLAAPTSSATSLNQIKAQKQDLDTKVEKLDEQINQVLKQIDTNKKDIDKVNKDIKDTQVQLDKSEQSIKSQQDLFGKRLRAMYINGVDSYVAVILESNSVGDFISRVDAVKKVISFDQKIMGDLKDKKKILADKKQILDDKNKKILSLKADNENKLSKLNGDKATQTKLLVDLRDKEKVLEAQDIAAAKIVASASSQVQKIRADAPRLSRGNGSNSAPASSNGIVAYASNFLGTPYQWGGNGPNRFDCSGFTTYVYGHFGVGLPRVASDQQGVGTAVSRDQLQPGDLVFFGAPAHHVGIYVGDGCYIHAPRTGDVIKISPLDRSDYSGARRVY